MRSPSYRACAKELTLLRSNTTMMAVEGDAGSVKKLTYCDEKDAFYVGLYRFTVISVRR